MMSGCLKHSMREKIKKTKDGLVSPSMLKNDIQSINNDYIWRRLGQRAAFSPGFILLTRSWRQCIHGMIDCGFVMRS